MDPATGEGPRSLHSSSESILGETQASQSEPSETASAGLSTTDLSPTATEPQITPASSGSPYDELINRVKPECEDDEKDFLQSVVDLGDTPDDYSHVHVSEAIVDVLESNLYVSVTRADQFDYGVLKDNRVTGGMLFGPPGTGKTLLAQAVAKKCRLNMLCISPGNIFGCHWGDDERAIRSAFGLARKLHPCLMFVDEADGILGRRQESDKKYVRTMLSEFLREWDGAATDTNRRRNPFVLLATNMPWDIDPAAVRRAPVRILIDVPTLKEREGILNIMLREEKLGSDVTTELIARLARSFSGSDLKSLCVSAAMRCVQQQKPDEQGVYEKKRVLERRHFDFALRYVKPSASDIFMSRKLVEFQRNTIL